MDGNCIFCFLTSERQKQLRKIAQLQADKFEDILEKYKEIFIRNFSISKSKKICNKHLSILNSYDINKNIKNITEDEIESFFNKIIEIYTKWISGEAYTSIEKLKTLMSSYSLLEEEELSITDKVFYRGRKAEERILNCYDMFHIPYDKRYLVGNQRFSLSGYPLLYLNASIDGVIAELDITEENFNEYVFSSFHFKEKSKIYSLANPFKDFLLKKYEKNSNNIYKEESISQKTIKRKLFKFILASICCFEKRIQHKAQEKKGINIFYEEYIIPQALTQVLKLFKYDGIFYPSTRIKEVENGLFSEKTFNLAYFPEYRQRHYDNVLYEKIDISTPISISNIEDLSDVGMNLNELIMSVDLSNFPVEKFDLYFTLFDIYVQNFNEYLNEKNNGKNRKNKKNKEDIDSFKRKSYNLNKNLLFNFLLKSILNISSSKGE